MSKKRTEDTYGAPTIPGARFDDMRLLQAPSTVQSGATLSMGQEALLQGYMIDNAAATRMPPAARPVTVCVCSQASSQCQHIRSVCSGTAPLWSALTRQQQQCHAEEYLTQTTRIVFYELDSHTGRLVSARALAHHRRTWPPLQAAGSC